MATGDIRPDAAERNNKRETSESARSTRLLCVCVCVCGVHCKSCCFYFIFNI